LFIQLPFLQKGLEAAVCYLTTSAKLPTNRIMQILDANPLLSRDASLNYIHTMPVPSISALIHILSTALPDFLSQQQNIGFARPFKLLVVDALAELFHTNDATNSTTLVERSHNIAVISSLLHNLSTHWKMAVVILNEVVDSFQHERPGHPASTGLDYRSQSQWYGRAENAQREASLGLVWANQINARIFLSRTNKRCLVGSAVLATGAEKVNDGHLIIRSLSVIFNGGAEPGTCEYVITRAGLSTLPNDEMVPPGTSFLTASIVGDGGGISAHEVPPSSQIAPLDAHMVPADLPDIVPSSQEEEIWEYQLIAMDARKDDG
jgi:DNA repair protein RAD57